ncbi:MAG: efflux transporter outer membrane subunit [Opitutales bacterium]
MALSYFDPPRWMRGAMIGTSLLLVACTREMPQQAGLVQTPEAFGSNGASERQTRWWQSFDDPKLNALILNALENSADLATIWERFQAADALARREQSGLFPEVDLFFRGQTEKGQNGRNESFNGGLSASYEIDFWGRIRSQTEAGQLRSEAALADYETAALSLTGEIAIAWYRILARLETLSLIEEQIRVNESVVESLLTRFQGGQARSVDVLRQEQLLEATRELKVVAESDIAVLQHRLSVLTGQLPRRASKVEQSKLPDLPDLPATGVPAELLLRRPDLQASYLKLLAADHDLASAISERFPRIDLTANLRSSTEGGSDLFDDWLRSAAGDLIGPIIDGGNRRAEVTRRKSLLRQRSNEFIQASLLAYQEVEDALIREEKETERFANLHRQLELQSSAFLQLRQEFLSGVGNYIDVLSSQTEAQQLERDLIESQRRQIEFRIALHRALAGPINAAEMKE